MKVIKSILKASEYCSQLKNKGRTIASVNTGGNLHKGHMHLVSMARDNADIVIVMIDFPAEYFNMNEDRFNRFAENYKSNVLDKDIKLCLENKVDIFFAPSMWDMYGEKTTKLKVFNSFIEDSIKREKSILWDFEHIMSFIKDYNILKTDVTVLGQKDIHQTMSMIGIINDLNFSVGAYTIATMPLAAANVGADEVRKINIIPGTSSSTILEDNVALLLETAANPTTGNSALYVNIFYRVLNIGTSF